MQVLFNITGFYDGCRSNVIPSINTHEMIFTWKSCKNVILSRFQDYLAFALCFLIFVLAF